MQLTEREITVVNSLVTHFYDVVPHEYNTYCSLTARILQSVLKHFGIDAKLIPCQVWLVTDEHNFVVGFLGTPSPRKWDGHVVCRARNVIIDAALQHFEKEFSMKVPKIIAAHCFDVPTQVISRRDLNPSTRLWWHYPPAEPRIDLKIPEEPPEMIARFANELTRHLSETPAVREHPGQDATTGMAAGKSNS